jgi:hypothetical protein
VNREAIEQRFTRAGWELDDSFSEYLIIGSNSDSLSILAYAPQAREPEDPVFELIDHERNLTSTGSSKYHPRSGPHTCSRSTAASHPRMSRATRSRRRREDFAVLGSLGAKYYLLV